MLNLLKKTTPWMVASLFVATSVFGQDGSCPKPCPPKCEPKPCAPACPPKPCAPACPPKPCPKPCPQPCPPVQVCPGQDPCCPPWSTPVLNAAYNYPARIQTRCPWDFYADASFIYWQPLQENMELGFANTTVPVGGAFTSGLSGNMINMDFNYKPGFKIGMGGYFDYDNWDMHLEYTWFHSKQHQNSNGPNPGQIWPAFGTVNVAANLYETASEHWRLNMDIAELDLGRWHYVGTKLTFRPNFGARAAWIRQHLNVSYDNTGLLGIGVADVATIHAKTTSWAIGAKAGLDTNWLVGSGFRLYGSGEADLLFTKYTRLTYSETHTSALVSSPLSVKQRRVYAVKPHMDLELGIGWGTYLDCNNWYMDFAAGYGFQVFFDQNMFRHFNYTIMHDSTMPSGNLYVHGLTATFRLEF